MTEKNTTEEYPKLQLSDVASVVNLIDICTKRGAFEGPELETVGALRNRLSLFVEASRPAVQEFEQNEETANA